MLFEHVASQGFGKNVGPHLLGRTEDKLEKLLIILLPEESPLNPHMAAVGLEIAWLCLKHRDAGVVILSDRDLRSREAQLNQYISRPEYLRGYFVDSYDFGLSGRAYHGLDAASLESH